MNSVRRNSEGLCLEDQVFYDSIAANGQSTIITSNVIVLFHKCIVV